MPSRPKWPTSSPPDYAAPDVGTQLGRQTADTGSGDLLTVRGPLDTTADHHRRAPRSGADIGPGHIMGGTSGATVMSVSCGHRDARAGIGWRAGSSVGHRFIGAAARPVAAVMVNRRTGRPSTPQGPGSAPPPPSCRWRRRSRGGGGGGHERRPPRRLAARRARQPHRRTTAGGVRAAACSSASPPRQNREPRRDVRCSTHAAAPRTATGPPTATSHLFCGTRG